jgi:predicted DsbA family dithiol-disulfide isomerase
VSTATVHTDVAHTLQDLIARIYENAISNYSISGAPFFMLSREGGSQTLTLSGAQSDDVLQEAFEALF